MGEPRFDLYFQVLDTLEELQIDYVIIGAFARGYLWCYSGNV